MIERREKKWMAWALAIFVFTSACIVLLNSFSMRHGWHWDFSISRYVGSETWSAVVFMIANAAVAYMTLQYLYIVGEKWKLPRWFYYVVILMAIGLIGLSAWPIAYFDPEGMAYGMSGISRIHELCSRTMFFGMLMVATVIMLALAASRATRLWAGTYVAYGLVCVYGFLSHEVWFAQMILVYETLYLGGFFVLGLLMQGKRERSEDGEEKTAD